jgi:hypothetical protein
MGTSTPNASGSINFVCADLSLNIHLISMKVTDDVREECVADILYTFGSAPTIIRSRSRSRSRSNDADLRSEDDSITISNALPEVFGVRITPRNPSPQSDLLCGYPTLDADGDSVGCWLRPTVYR